MSSFTQYQTIPLFIYAFVNVTTVAYYINYTIIIDKINALLNTFFESSTASLGNLVAEGNREKVLSIYWTIFNIRHFVATVVVGTVFILINSFIKLWLGGEYVLSNATVLLILCILYIGIVRTDQFLFAFGLFNDVWASVVMMLISLISSFVMGWYFGLNGILLGNFLGLFVIIGIWKPYFLFRCGLNSCLSVYWAQFFINLIILISLTLSCIYFISINFERMLCVDWIGFLFYSGIVVLYMVVLATLFFGIKSSSFRKEMHKLLKRVI